MAGLESRMRDHLAAFPRQDAVREGLRHAAVAVTVVIGEGGRPGFLLTRRTGGLRAHPGQWALPGGRVDAGEASVAAALRELAEEVGLVLPEAAVLGRLDDYPTRSGYVISPVVVWAGDTGPLRPNPAEVESIHHIPLATLEGPDVPRLLPGTDPDRPIIQVPIGAGRLIHAPTAAVLYQLREVAMYGRWTRVAHFDQPTWARR